MNWQIELLKQYYFKMHKSEKAAGTTCQIYCQYTCICWELGFWLENPPSADSTWPKHKHAGKMRSHTENIVDMFLSTVMCSENL